MDKRVTGLDPHIVQLALLFETAQVEKCRLCLLALDSTAADCTPFLELHSTYEALLLQQLPQPSMVAVEKLNAAELVRKRLFKFASQLQQQFELEPKKKKPKVSEPAPAPARELAARAEAVAQFARELAARESLDNYEVGTRCMWYGNELKIAKAAKSKAKTVTVSRIDGSNERPVKKKDLYKCVI